MRVKKQTTARWVLRGVSLAATLLVVGCTPDIGDDPTPAYMVFDTETGQVPEPNIVALNTQTGKLDFGVLGLVVPEGSGACLDATGWEDAVAECEFYQYLESLDGYPTLSFMRTPASAPLDPDTVTHAGLPDDNLAVVDAVAGRKVTDLAVSWNDAEGYLYIDNPVGWDIGRLYVGAVRGYEHGVKTTDGSEVVGPVAYSLLKREESLLDCTPDDPLPDPSDLVDPVADPDCKYYELVTSMVAEQYPDPVELDAVVSDLLVSLETLRQAFIGDGQTGIWAVTEALGDMPKSEVAIAWAWPTHSNPVVELHPGIGIVPEPFDATGIQLAVKGELDNDTLVPFTGINGDPGSADPSANVYLLNTTQLAAGNFSGAILQHTARFVDGYLRLETTTPFVAGENYAIMLVAALDDDDAHSSIRSLDGEPLVPSPITVYLRTRGPLAVDGVSQVSKLDDESAVALEEGRLALAELLTDPLFGQLTGDLVRESIAYMYAFDYPAE